MNRPTTARLSAANLGHKPMKGTSMLKSLGTAAAMLIASHAAFAQSGPGEAQFDLEPNPAFLACLAPGAPSAHVIVKRGNLNDTLLLRATGLKPNLQFHMFTVQRSPLDANGKPVANFKGFGMAWYQSDIEADENAEAKVLIKTGPDLRLRCRSRTGIQSAEDSVAAHQHVPSRLLV
jgi:hypothetical protein